MGSKNCMNEVCRTTTSFEWKKGWSLKSGGFATLCYNCGTAYENSIFCKTFHLEESGWRECRICGKPIHCGCIASRYLHEFMDFGGVGCISCARLETHTLKTIKIPSDVPNVTPTANGSRNVHPLIPEDKADDANFSTERLLFLTKAIDASDINSALYHLKQEESPFPKNQESNQHSSNFTKQRSPSAFVKGENSRPMPGIKDVYESLAQLSIPFSLTTPIGGSNTLLPFHCGVDGNEQNKVSFQQGKGTQHIFPMPSKPPLISGSEMNRGAVSQTRVARPPAEGRGRNQLLPRYWPRITDQELQQLSGDLKSTIVPLFEKILSASDAGRIGRLVLPKACAETYFPPINQSEGIPIRIQDIKGKEWTFQFRFWPNNNSRMYVLEGVTPCIQNMQMQAGDTVTFSRRAPGGQLVIGCRKATNNADEQDSQALVFPKGESLGENNTDIVLSNGGRIPDDSDKKCLPTSEKKKMRNIKNKRLLMNSDDALELKITWEEAQELLRPSLSAKSTVVMVEDHEFEEFDEPPIFGKRTIFTSRSSGETDQWTQCDNCRKWRRLPVDALLFDKWTCTENICDPNRCSCGAPEDINPKDLDSLLEINRDHKKRKMLYEKAMKGEPCGLDALATAAVLGDSMTEIGESSTGATTKHPRHRPGCSCIVCIQPPSGKGKHEPTCKCNVCLTVKRRFKTLMMRKKKRQSEREAELALMKDKSPVGVSLEIEDIAGHALLHMNLAENEPIQRNSVETNKGQLDLNCDPHREEDMMLGAAGMNLTTLMNTASLPLDICGGQNGPSNLELPGFLPEPVSEREEKCTGEGDSASGDATKQEDIVNEG